MRNLKICWVCLWITPGWAACSLPLCGLWQPGFLVRILPVHTHEAGVLGSSLIVPWPTAGFQDTNMEHRRGLASNSCLVTYWLHDFRWIISCLLGLASSNTTSDDNTTCFWKLSWTINKKIEIMEQHVVAAQPALVPFSGILKNGVQCRALWVVS